MALLERAIILEELPVADSFDVIPEGTYDAKTTQADLKTTKSGTGKYIRLRWDITGPTHQGRVVWQNLNIQNQNPMAEEIGQKQLREMADAIGLTGKITDTDQLVGGHAKIKVIIRKQDGYDDQNDVKRVLPLSDNTATTTPFAAPNSGPAPSPVATGQATPPWANRKASGE